MSIKKTLGRFAILTGAALAMGLAVTGTANASSGGDDTQCDHQLAAIGEVSEVSLDGDSYEFKMGDSDVSWLADSDTPGIENLRADTQLEVTGCAADDEDLVYTMSIEEAGAQG